MATLGLDTLEKRMGQAERPASKPTTSVLAARSCQQQKRGRRTPNGIESAPAFRDLAHMLGARRACWPMELNTIWKQPRTKVPSRPGSSNYSQSLSSSIYERLLLSPRSIEIIRNVSETDQQVLNKAFQGRSKSLGFFEQRLYEANKHLDYIAPMQSTRGSSLHGKQPNSFKHTLRRRERRQQPGREQRCAGISTFQGQSSTKTNKPRHVKML